MACMDPRGTVVSIYKGEYYTLVHTTYESSGPYGFGEEDFYVVFFPIVSLRELLTPRGGAISDPRGMLDRIYVKLHITMLHTKYRSIGWALWFRRRRFYYVFPMPPPPSPQGRGLYGPQWHGWQDLYRGPLYI